VLAADDQRPLVGNGKGVSAPAALLNISDQVRLKASENSLNALPRGLSQLKVN
jgi:hypothetical protein